MALKANEYALWLFWGLLTLTVTALKNPVHDMLFPTEDAMKAVLSVITFAPGVLEALQAATPPTIAFFKSLPTASPGTWGIYVIVLEKAGCRPKIYIGSGTGAQWGLVNRLIQYSDDSTRMARYITEAIQAGYSITHKRVLCWAPIPTAATRFPLRALFLIIETAFSLAFWAMHSKTKIYGMPNLLSWPINAFDYDGCCSHVSIWEIIAGEADGLDAAQIAAKEAAADVRRKEGEKRARLAYYDRRNAEDFEFWRKRKNAQIKRSDAKMRASKRYRCDPCNFDFKSQFALDKHKLRPSHVRMVTGVKKHIKHPEMKRKADAAKAARTHYCSLCDTAFPTPAELRKHNIAPRHLKKAAAAAAAAEATAESGSEETTAEESGSDELD